MATLTQPESSSPIVNPRTVLVTGGTGYLGRALLPTLIARGHRVRALVRLGSELKLSPGVTAVAGNPLNADDVLAALGNECDTLVHLVGVAKPSPAKARQFREVDLASIQASVAAAVCVAPRPHLIYLSVAQPAPGVFVIDVPEIKRSGDKQAQLAASWAVKNKNPLIALRL